MKICLIGYGNIGKKRINCLDKEDELISIVDTNEKLKEEVEQKHHCSFFTDYKEGIINADAVIISTIHNKLAEISLYCLQNNKLNIFVEKPAARNLIEFLPIYNEYKKHKNIIFKVGFNHRFHPAILKAKEITNSGAIGELLFIKGNYGHGGRKKMESEWRCNPELSGGGELIDQFPHLLDLSRWFLGDFEKICGVTKTYFWESKVEDNVFVILETTKGQISQLNASWTEWKNTFSFEIYGKYGKLHIKGLGNSYGIEQLYYYQMKPEMGPPETIIYEYPDQNNSWKLEWDNFKNAILGKEKINGSIEDVYEVLKIVDKIYKK